MLVDAEYWSRHNNRLKRNIHNACLEQPQASLADINFTSDRILDNELVQTLGTGQYIREQHNVIIVPADPLYVTFSSTLYLLPLDMPTPTIEDFSNFLSSIGGAYHRCTAGVFPPLGFGRITPADLTLMYPPKGI